MNNEWDIFKAITVENKPMTVCLDLDTYYGVGMASLEITVNGVKFFLSKDQVFEILYKLKNGKVDGN